MKTRRKVGFIQIQESSEPDKIEQMYEKAAQFSAIDPEITLVQCRRIVDYVCQSIFSGHFHYEDINERPIDFYIDLFLQHEIIPKPIAIHFRVVQILTEEYKNDTEVLFQTYVQPCLSSVIAIKEWYLSGEPNTMPEVLNRQLPQLPSEIRTRDTANETRLATGGFAQIDDLNGLVGDDGLVIGQNLRLNMTQSFEHCVCVGPTGSGKSAGFFIPNLLLLPKNCSVVVTDPKEELLEQTRAVQERNGKEILIFNPYSTTSLHYNPLALCKTTTDIRELAQILLINGNAAMSSMAGHTSGSRDQIEWLTMAVPLLASILIFVRDLKSPKNTIHYALNLITENDDDALKFLVSDDLEAKEQMNIFLQSSQSEKTSASIRVVLASQLQLFLDPMISNITSKNEINPTQLRQAATVLYVTVPEHKSSFMAPIMAVFYHQLMNALVDSAGNRPVFFLLDEFANIGLIPNIDTALATYRSKRISIAIGIQSLNQLKQKYGTVAESILDNLKCKFFLPGMAYDSASYFSNLMGDTEIVTTSSSGASDATITYSKAPQVRPLMSPDEIRRLSDEMLVAIIANRKPFIDMQRRYYKDSILLKMINPKQKSRPNKEY